MFFDFKNLQAYLTCKDHLVSGEKFDLLYNPEYDLLVTSPKPSSEKLPEYYKSESYISHTDSRKSVFDRIYQLVKAIMLKKKMRLIEKYQPGKGKILDIGTGTGDFLVKANKTGWKIEGTEPNEKARKIALEKGLVLKSETEVSPDAHFDAITMWHVLEHVPNLEKQLSELKRLLKKNGVLFIAVPNFKSYDAKHYAEFWAAYDVPRHLWHFSKKSVEKLFGSIGFELVETLPLKFDSYYVSLLSEKNKIGSTNFLKAMGAGFRSNLKAKRTHEYSSLIYVLKKREF